MKDILKCWTPVKAECSDKKFSAEVWGRRYEFDGSPLPTEVVTQNQSILDAPISLTPIFGEEKGEWEDFSSMLYSADDEKAVFVTSQTSHNVILDTAVSVEYDGFVKVDLKLMSYWSFSKKEKPTLTGLYMDIPVKKEYAALMHYWPNDRQSIIPAGNIMNSGKTHDMSFPFKPYVSLGSNEVGLGVFFGESAKNFLLNDEDKCIEIKDMGEYVNIRLNILDAMPTNWNGRKDRWISTLKPLTYTFGFHATPVKPMRTGDDTYKIYHLGRRAFMEKDGKINRELIDKLVETDVKWLILHEDWTAIQNYGFPQNVEFTKDFIKECHKHNIKVMVYFGYEYSTLVPNWSDNADKYLIKTTDNQFCGGWQRLPHQRAFMVCYRGGYSAEMISRVEYVMDELGVDGIYTDGTYVPWECANTAHGCGYTDDNGKLHTSFPVLAVREHVKKLYEAVHSRGGIIDTHQSSCCIMPTLAFCDSYYDGENIQGMLSKKDMSFLDLDAFRAEYMGYNFGIPANFIAYTKEDRPMSTLYALSLLHNVHCRPGGLHLGFLQDIDYNSKIWKIFDKYALNSAPWHPYWNNELVSAEGDAHVSVYEAKEGLVAVCADFKKSGITLVTDKLSATDLLDGKEYRAKDGKIEIDSDMATLNILLLK